MDKSLVQLTASEVVEGLEKGEISPLELISQLKPVSWKQNQLLMRCLHYVSKEPELTPF